jgi:hypothetical protein
MELSAWFKGKPWRLTHVGWLGSSWRSQRAPGPELGYRGVDRSSPTQPPGAVTVFEPGQESQNATNEPKLADDPIIAEVQKIPHVMADSSSIPGLDKRANEPKEGASSPGLERRVPNLRTQAANPESEPPDLKPRGLMNKTISWDVSTTPPGLYPVSFASHVINPSKVPAPIRCCNAYKSRKRQRQRSHPCTYGKSRCRGATRAAGQNDLFPEFFRVLRWSGAGSVTRRTSGRHGGKMRQTGCTYSLVPELHCTIDLAVNTSRLLPTEPTMSAKKRRKVYGVRRETRRPRGWTRWFNEGLFDFDAGSIRLRSVLWGQK